MSGVSTKSLYGVIATYYIFKNQEKGAIKSVEIAQKMGIPQNFLEQILLVLKKSNILKSIRGANGGYVLSKSGAETTAIEIIESLDGAICEFHFGDRECRFQSFWMEVTQKVKEIFNVTLDKLEEYDNKNTKELMYMI